MSSINRRQWLSAASIAAAGVSFNNRLSASPQLANSQLASEGPRAVIQETKVVSHLPHRYHGWPTLARRRNGQLLLVCSGGRQSHICPFGRVELMRSSDDGDTWSWPRVVVDSAIDDRDAGVLETAKGTLLVTTFSSLAYEANLERARKSGSWTKAKLAGWEAAHGRVSAKQRQEQLGVWMIRSTDGGVSWSERYRTELNSPHGPVNLSDGRLLYAGRQLWQGKNRVGVCHSTDDGRSWEWLAEIPTRQGDSAAGYHELHAVEAADGRLVVHIRNHNAANSRETLQSHSSDGGKTWSVPATIGVWGLPSHLLRLADDRLLMTYGHRRKPLGNQARVSSDHGRSWSQAMILSGDGPSGDLGYPSTVELGDGSLLTVWYEAMKGSPHAVLRQAHWTIDV